MFLTNARSNSSGDHAATYHRYFSLLLDKRCSDLFSMLGTIFLWMFWPSFNGALAPDAAGFTRAGVNTVISLAGSCATAFLFSFILRQRNKFSIVFVQD